MPISPLTGADFEKEFGNLFAMAPAKSAIEKIIDRIDGKMCHLPANVESIGVVEHIDNYLAAKNYSSHDIALAIKNSMWEIYYNKHLRIYKGEQKHFQFGSFVHQAILEPELFNKVLVAPTFKGNVKAEIVENIYFLIGICKVKDIDVDTYFNADAKMDELKIVKDKLESSLLSAGITFISEDDLKVINIYKQRIDNYGDGIIGKLLGNSIRERSLYGDIGLPVKVRPDAIAFEENIGVNAVISVKTTRCESIRAYMSSAASLDYAYKEAVYQEVVSKAYGRKFDTTIMIILQNVEPYDIAVLILDQGNIQLCRSNIQLGISRIKQANETGYWGGFETYSNNKFGLIDAQFPEWGLPS